MTELDMLRVVGIHAVVQGDETPVLCAPIYADSAGRLVAIELDDRGSIRISTSTTDTVDGAAGHGTLFDPLPPRLGWQLVVLGDMERRHAGWLAASTEPEARDASRVLLGEEAAIETRPVDAAVALYLAPGPASRLWSAIAECARRAVGEAATAGDAAELERSAWWLQRAALGSEDIVLAAAALKRAQSPDWRDLLSDYFPDEDRTALERRAENAERSLGGPRYAGLTAARDRFRKRLAA